MRRGAQDASRFARHTISFELHFSEDAQVDSISLDDSTLEDQGLEACMVGVLRSLSLEDLPLRGPEQGSYEPMAPESRGFMAQEQVLLCLASPPCLMSLGLLVGASFLVVQIYVHAAQSGSVKPWPRLKPIATAIPTVAPVGDQDDPCQTWIVECLENKTQPAWNRGTYGSEKDCGACGRECRRKKGVWPDYKCPRD